MPSSALFRRRPGRHKIAPDRAGGQRQDDGAGGVPSGALASMAALLQGHGARLDVGFESLLRERLAPPTRAARPFGRRPLRRLRRLVARLQRGFHTIGYEMDADRCESYRRNLSGACERIALSPTTPLPPS